MLTVARSVGLPRSCRSHVVSHLLQEMAQRLHAGGNVVRADRVALDRFGAAQEAVERPRDPKVIRREILAGFQGAVFEGIGCDHVPFLTPKLYSYSTRRNRRGT